MKKIINGKKYNTDTAQRLGEWDNGQYGNFDYEEETLYRKKTGEFFICGSGGAASKYACSVREGTASGSQISPISWEEARKWAEYHLQANEYEKIFGDVFEDESKVNTNITFSAEAYQLVKRIATEREITISAVVNDAIKYYGENTK